MEGIVEATKAALDARPFWAPILALAGGALTAANPCVIVMVPLMLAFLSAQGADKAGGRRRIVSVLLFTVGLSITFAIMGVAAIMLGTLFGTVGKQWFLIGGILCLLIALHLFGIVNWSFPLPEKAKKISTGWLGALLLGMLFGLVSSPCATPVLAVVLAYIASSPSNIAFGFLLLLFYAIGHCILVLVAGFSYEAVSRIAGDRRIATANLILKKVSGVIFAVAGVYLLLK